MPLNAVAMHAAVRITSIGSLLGTGFCITVDSESIPGVKWGYLLTAHHVIRHQIEIDAEVPNPFSNGELYPPVRVEDWRQPLKDVDLAIAPFQRPADRAYHGIDLDAHVIPTERVPVPALGRTVYYVGIFAPLGRPMVRSGTIGALDQEGIPHEGGYTQLAHLVDCRSYDGFSGSPCFIELGFATDTATLPPSPHRDATVPPLKAPNYYTLLCGMFTGHFTDEERAEGVVSRYGVGAMLRGNEIKEALMTEKARAERRQWDAEHAASHAASTPPLKSASGPPSKQEFERFEDLTRQVLKVPKEELDEKRKEDS